MPPGFDQALQAGRLLFDGPIGTELLSRGQRPPFEELNAASPALVREVHRSYVAAGARVLRANTLLARPGAVADSARLARLGVALAREAASPEVWVGAPVGGPVRIPPPGKGRRAAPPGFADAVARQVEALAAAEPDFLSFETFLRSEDLGAALAAVRPAFGGPVIAFATLRADLPTRLDAMSVQRVYASLGRFLEVAVRHGALAVGVNCVPPGALLELARDFLAREAPGCWGLLPSAPAGATGRPGRAPSGQDARESERLVLAACQAAHEAGASFVGGCCGVTPSIIRRLARMLRPPRVRILQPARPTQPGRRRASEGPRRPHARGDAAPRARRGQRPGGRPPAGRWKGRTDTGGRRSAGGGGSPGRGRRPSGDQARGRRPDGGGARGRGPDRGGSRSGGPHKRRTGRRGPDKNRADRGKPPGPPGAPPPPDSEERTGP